MVLYARLHPVSGAGTSLVELIVFFGIGVLLIGALFSLMLNGTRHLASAENRLDGLIATHLALARLRQDLRQIDASPESQPIVAEDGRSLSFRIREGRESASSTVRWRWSPVHQLLERNGTAVAQARFGSVAFARPGDSPHLVWIRLEQAASSRPVPGSVRIGLESAVRLEPSLLSERFDAWVETPSTDV